MRLHTRTVAALAALLLSLSCDSVSSPATVSTPAPETQAAPKRQPPGPTDSPLIYGRVVGVSGGDDVTVLDAGRRRHEIRPLGVDAPEKGQDFGGRSKHCPSDIIFGRDVRAEYEKKGRYGRTLGKVMVGGRGANLEQVRAGLACFYGHHAGDVPEADRAALDGAEREARQSKRELWAQPNPTPLGLQAGRRSGRRRQGRESYRGGLEEDQRG